MVYTSIDFFQSYFNHNITTAFRFSRKKAPSPLCWELPSRCRCVRSQRRHWRHGKLIMGVSKNLGTSKWMVYNGKPYLKWMIWGEHHFRKHPYFTMLPVMAANLCGWTCLANFSICGWKPVICQERLRSLISQHQVMLFMKGDPDAPRCGFSRVSSSHHAEFNCTLHHYHHLAYAQHHLP